MKKFLKYFNFSLEKKPLSKEIHTIYRGSENCTDLSIKKNGEASFGRGVYFAEDKENALTYNEKICQYQLPQETTLCIEPDAGIGTIDGADDYFKDGLENFKIHVESESKEERKWYNKIANEIKNHYTSLGCDGLYTDWQIVIWNKEILEKMKETTIEL